MDKAGQLTIKVPLLTSATGACPNICIFCSGKSFTVATLIEKIAELKSCNAILFDIHGEYEPIIGENIQHYHIAGPADTPSEHTMFLPYWLLNYEEMLALMLDRSDSNAPNQAMVGTSASNDNRMTLK